MTIGLPLTIPNSFVRTARWFGDGEAVVNSATRLTYAELDRLSRRAVALFASLGAVPGEPLALLCPPSAIYLVAWLGAVRLGALPMALHTRKSAATLAAVCRRMGARSPRLRRRDGRSWRPALRRAVRNPLPASKPCRRCRRSAAECLRRLHRSQTTSTPAVPRLRLARPAENDAGGDRSFVRNDVAPQGVVHTHRGFIENARSEPAPLSGIAAARPLALCR